LVNGSSFYTQTITLIFHRREAAKSKAIKVLGEGQRDLALVVGDANGKYWYFPKAQLTAVTEGSGTAKADGSKYSVTFVAENEQLAYEVEAAEIPNII
jgi:lysine/ornithine N-monooxygenase